MFSIYYFLFIRHVKKYCIFIFNFVSITMTLNEKQRHKLGDFSVNTSLILIGTLVIGQLVSDKPLNWIILLGGLLSASTNLIFGLWLYGKQKEN